MSNANQGRDRVDMDDNKQRLILKSGTIDGKL